MPPSVSVKFPEVVAAVRAAEDCPWKVGDALIKECGPPGNHGVNNGALDKLDQCVRELRGLGFETSREYLRDLRRTAANFPDGVRTPSVPFTVHLEAGDPATLKAAMEAAARDGVRPTVDYVKGFKTSQRQEEDHAEDRRSAITLARRELEKALVELLDLRASMREIIEIIYSGCERAQRWLEFTTVIAKYFRRGAT